MRRLPRVLPALSILLLVVPLAHAQNGVWWKWIRVDYTATDGVINHGRWKRSDAYDSGRDCRWSFPNHGQMASWVTEGTRYAVMGDQTFIHNPEGYTFIQSYKCLPDGQEP
jgi:hypothetical protein